MLEAIRKHAKGWLAKVILALIAVTFALFGVDSYMKGDRSGGMVAEVGKLGISSEELSREIQAQSDRMREALGPAFDASVTETAEFRKQVQAAYEEPGNALWRAAANEVKLLLEQRLGMAKK